MSNELRAGFGRSDITPKLGSKLTGYGNRAKGATGVHDALLARALVLEDTGGTWALISIDFCYLFPQTVAEIRAVIESRVGIPASNVFIATTHTHSGPHDRDDNWERPLGEIVADAVEQAKAALQPAQVGTGYSFLYGYSINRRWLDKPADPAILVLRVDDAQGNLLGLLSIHGCHSVVLGYDNFEISGDWPGYAMYDLEEKLGGDITSMFFQGGAGDINPLVEGVRKRIRSGKPVRAIGEVSTYYGTPDDPNTWGIGDRGGGTFEEVAELGNAYAEEVAHVLQTIKTSVPELPIWAEQITINAAASPGEYPERPEAPILSDMLDGFDFDNIPTELMLFALGDLLLVGEPGEVFSETAVNLRVWLRNMGYKAPMLVSYANGWFFYLPEPTAFPEGGYEPKWAATINISKQYQAKVWNAVKPVLQQRADTLSLSA